MDLAHAQLELKFVAPGVKLACQPAPIPGLPGVTVPCQVKAGEPAYATMFWLGHPVCGFHSPFDADRFYPCAVCRVEAVGRATDKCDACK